MDNYYIFIGYVFLELLAFLFINFWGKKVLLTFISGIFFILAISNYRNLIIGNMMLNIFLTLFSTFSFFLLIYLSLLRINNSNKETDSEESRNASSFSIFKEKTIYFSVFICVIMGIISFFINKRISPELQLADATGLFMTMLILPLSYEIFIHEIIWKLIDTKKSFITKLFLYIICTGVLIWLSCADWAYNMLMVFSSSFTLIGAGVFRIIKKENSYFWVCILFRGIFYFIMFSFV